MKNTWHTFSLPFDSSLWTVTSGSWSALLLNVTTIEIALEYYQGTSETVYFDNFCIENSGITGIRQMSTNEGIHIFPNPSNGIFTVELSSSNVSGQLDLKICDLTGKQIYEGIYLGKSRYEIDLSEFAKGVYIISVNSSAKSWQSKIIID